LRPRLSISFNKFATTKTTNYLISIQSFRIYNKKSIVRRFETNKLISLAIIKINKNANKKEININKTIIITIIIKTIILTIKNLVRDVQDLKKEIKIAITKIAIKIKIVTTIIVNNNNLFFQKYAKIANVVIKTQYATIVTKQIINNNTTSKVIKKIAKTLS